MTMCKGTNTFRNEVINAHARLLYDLKEVAEATELVLVLPTKDNSRHAYHLSRVSVADRSRLHHHISWPDTDAA